MRKDNFHELLRVLNIQVVVFIDDDFTPIPQAEAQLIHLCLLQENEFDFAIKALEQKDLHNIAQNLTKFRSDFSGITLTNQDNDWLNAQAIIRMLTLKKETALAAAASTICDQLNSATEFIQELTMNLGLANSLENYDELIKVARNCSLVKSIRLYKILEGQALNEFTDYASQLIKDAPGKMMLAVVDKVLGGKEAGQEIIKGFRQVPVVKDQMLSIIYTSQDVTPSIAEGLDKFFDVQVLKTNATLDSIAINIAKCAFVLMLEKIILARQSALEDTKELVASEGISNVLYIASMAHVEGITSHYAIDHWVELFSNKVAADKLYIPPSDFRLICGLTGLLNDDFFPKSSKPSGVFAKHLNELRAFELYNNHVNALHSPPGPGDIFDIDGQLYILTGQECDLIVRAQGGGAVERKEKIAELTKADFVPGQLDVKFQPEGEDSEGIKVNYFNYLGTEGHLHIHFNQRNSIDFRVLDLCSINESGGAIFDLEAPVSQYVLDVMPRMWSDYSKTLMAELKDKIKLADLIKEKGINTRVLEGDISFGLEVKTVNNKSTYPIKRIARLKGQIKDVFLQRYFQYKTRKGTDTILLHNQKEVRCKSLKVGFAHNTSICHTAPESIVLLLSNDRERNKDISKLDIALDIQSLSAFIQPVYHEALKRIPQQELIFSAESFHESQSQITFKKKFKESEVELEIIIPYFNDYLKVYFQPAKNNLFSFNEIFGENISSEGVNNYVVEGQNKPWQKFAQIIYTTRIDLEKEINVEGIGKAKLNTDNGVLTVSLTPKHDETTVVHEFK